MTAISREAHDREMLLDQQAQRELDRRLEQRERIPPPDYDLLKSAAEHAKMVTMRRREEARDR